MNRRWVAIVLFAALLCGCERKKDETAPSEALYETKPTETVGFSSFSDLPSTGGAVQAITLDIRDAVGFRFVGDDILVFSGYQSTGLALLDGYTFAVKAETVLPGTVTPEGPGVSVDSGGVTYVDHTAQDLVFLNSLLEETGRFPLPEDCGIPVLDPHRNLLYYCTSASLRVLDLNTGIDRPVKEMTSPMQEVLALHCGGSILQCRVTFDDGTVRTLFLSAQDGRLLQESTEAVPLWTHGAIYFSTHMDGMYRELLSGAADHGPSLLVTEETPTSITAVLEKKLVLLHTDGLNGGINLDAYHLESGRHTAHITLPEGLSVTDLRPDPDEDALWLLCHDQKTDKDQLCRWDLKLTDPEDPHSYLQPRWSRDNPDLEGLAQCEAIAAELSAQHGVQILLNAAAFDCTGYRLVPEYQVPLIRESLQVLHRTLSRYPEGFLKELAQPTGTGKLHIGLVRSIGQEGTADAELPSLLDRDSQGNIWLILTPGPDLERQVNLLLCDLIDSRVLGCSDAYDGWNRTEPSVIGHWERVRILELAMQDDQAPYFASGTMESSLRQICLGIRETFRCLRFADTPFWEQHLSPPPGSDP